LTGSSNDVTEYTAAPGFIIFGQAEATTPFFVAEGLENSVFETYDLASDLASTTGTLSFTLPSTFETSLGDLVFTDITSLSFEASLPTVPEPPTWTLMLVGMSFLGYRALRRGNPAS